MPTTAHTARYTTTNIGTLRAALTDRARFITAGTAPGSIIAAIIGTQTAMKAPKEPRSVATPRSMPRIWRSATSQHTAARASVATTAIALRLVTRIDWV